MKLNTTIFLFLLLLVGESISAQNYPKAPNAIRLLTYNTHYCKGATDPGAINKENTQKFAQIIAALDADIVALQELDSASVHRGNRYLLQEIANETGIEYVPVYGGANEFDHGNIGCGVLVKKELIIQGTQKILLPGDETRALVKVEFDHFIFMATHLDLNDSKRISAAKIICQQLKGSKKPFILAGDLNDSHAWGNGGIAFPTFAKKFKIISDINGSSIPGRTGNTSLIDYILVSKRPKKSTVSPLQSHIVRSISVGNDTIDTATISDHYPVFVDIKK